MEGFPDPSEGKAGPESLPAGPVAQGPAGTKMTKDAGTIGTDPAPGRQLLTILMLIIRFLPENRKKHARRNNKSYAKKEILSQTLPQVNYATTYKLILYTFVSRFSKPSAR